MSFPTRPQRYPAMMRSSNATLLPFAVRERMDLAILNGHEMPKQTSMPASRTWTMFISLEHFDAVHHERAAETCHFLRRFAHAVFDPHLGERAHAGHDE